MTSQPPRPPAPPARPKLPPPNLGIPLRPASRRGVWFSLVAHLVVLLLLVEVTRGGLWWEPEPLDGPGLDNAGGGGGSGQEISLIPLAPVPPAAPVVKQPVVVPPPIPPAPTVTPQQIPPVDSTPPVTDTTATNAAASSATTGTGGGSGGGSGGGTGPGTGPGSGPGNAGSGNVASDTAKSLGRPPEPRQLILPPFDYPKNMRGLTIQVTFFVLADGRVDRVVFGDEIPDRGYAKKLEDVLKAYRFRPARSPAGMPIAGNTTVSISF